MQTDVTRSWLLEILGFGIFLTLGLGGLIEFENCLNHFVRIREQIRGIGSHALLPELGHSIADAVGTEIPTQASGENCVAPEP